MVLTEGRHAAEFILSEDDHGLSRENAVIAESQTIVPGTVLGKVGENEGAVTVGAPDGTGNTGAGALTRATPAYGDGVQEGTYVVTCVEKVTSGGVFDVYRPDGTRDGQAVEGAAYDGQIKFQIDASGADFEVGDKFTLAVTIAAAADEGQYKALDLTASDGAEVASAIAIYGVTTGSGETAKISIIKDLAAVNQNLITWPAGITTPQKTAAIAQLRERNIKVR